MWVLHVDSQYAGKKNAAQLDLAPAWNLKDPKHNYRDAKQEYVAKQRDSRVDAVDEAPLQTLELVVPRLEVVRPEASDWHTVEDEEEELREVTDYHDRKDDFDGQQEFSMDCAKSVVEGETGKSAEKQ